MAVDGAAMAFHHSFWLLFYVAWSVSVFVTHKHHGGKNYAIFANAAASHPACIMPQHREKYRFPCEGNDIVWSRGGKGGEGEIGHGWKCSPPSVCGLLVFSVFSCFFLFFLVFSCFFCEGFFLMISRAQKYWRETHLLEGRINKLKEKIFVSTPSLSITIIARLLPAMIAKTALIAVGGLP